MRSKKGHISGEMSYEEQMGNNLHMLLKNISSLSRAVELQTVLCESLDVVQKVMNTEASSLMLIDESTGELVVSMPVGPVEKEIKGKRVPEGKGIGGWVIEHQQSYFTNDVGKDEIFGGDLSDAFITRNIICSPLCNRNGKILGVLQAINRRDDEEFDEKDVWVFEALADHVAISIERTREVEKLRQELEEKEMMLREVHHRIKNNLSTLTALIEMEFNEVEDERAELVLKKTCSRIGSMTEVHDLLHNTGLSHFINLGSYLKRLTRKIAETLSDPSKKVSIDIQADPIQIDSERAMCCGLVMNELLINAYKHAFKNKPQGGTIFIELKLDEEGFICLHVSDNGSGIGKDFKLDDSGSIGSWLINALLRRLNATVDINQSNGTSFMIRFQK